MKALIAILLTIIFITGIGGCGGCGDGYYEDINKMEIYVFHAGGQGSVEEIKPVAYDSVIVQATFSGTSYGVRTNMNSINFLPSAVASDDCPGSFGSKETIENITVITLSDFDNDFKANDTINSIVEATDYFIPIYTSREFKDLSQYIAEIQPGIHTGNFNLDTTGGLFLKLKKKPIQKVIKLRLDVAFTNGEKYSAETIPVSIKQ